MRIKLNGFFEMAGLAGSLLLAMPAACSHGSSSKSSSTTPAAPAPSDPNDSAVNDPTQVKDLVAGQIEISVNALSDGGTGSGGGGGGDAGLVDFSLADFAETRTCAASKSTAVQSITAADGSTSQVSSGATIATVTRSYSGTIGAITYSSNSDGSPSSDTEKWYPGADFGLQNITPDSASDDYGTVPAPSGGNALPPIPSPIDGAASGSSGKLGSVGWRSTDGSWTGAPVWEVAIKYVGQGLAAAQTEGMVMYLTSNMPTVTAATTAPAVGGAYAPLAMVTALGGKASAFSVLGQLGGGALPSFQAGGMAMIDGAATKVDQAGTITANGTPARIYNPPTALACAADGVNVAPGWRFSQNVADLTKTVTNKMTYTRTNTAGVTAFTTAGGRAVTWSDPALVPPVAASTSAPYFDQNAATLSLTRAVALGTAAAPNTLTSENTPTGQSAKPLITNAVYTSVPLADTIVRNLNDPEWAWVTRTVASGTITATHAVGSGSPVATALTTFSGVQWINNSDKTLACVPTAGTITTVITPEDTTKQVISVLIKFGSSAGITSPSGVTSTVSCSGGAPGAANCTAQAETDDPDYKPSDCNF